MPKSLTEMVGKLKQTNLNPYIINWIISFLTNRKQRVMVDGIITGYVDTVADTRGGQGGPEPPPNNFERL
jgi:hypothetical protein